MWRLGSTAGAHHGRPEGEVKVDKIVQVSSVDAKCVMNVSSVCHQSVS